jgi:hypothetical protein
MPDQPDVPTFAEWCIVELFGHQRYAGLVRQAEWPPGFARLEIPATPGHEAVTQLLSPQSIYRLAPTTETIATAVAAQCRPEPIHRWELPAAPVETRVCCPDGRFHPCEEHDPDGYAAWAEEGMAMAADPDPDYGKDLDDEGDDGPF